MSVNGFVVTGDTLWGASSGGLVVKNLQNEDTVVLLSSSQLFPDPFLTGICKNQNGEIWITSRRGYLYRRTSNGNYSVYDNYLQAGWGLTAIFARGNLLVVGSAKGVSIFDPVRGVALRNAVSIADFTNPRVNKISGFRDTLFLGCEEGVAYLDSLDILPLKNRNFYDAGIWKTRRQAAVVDFVVTSTRVIPCSSASVMFRGKLLSEKDGKIVYEGSPVTETNFGKILSLYNEDDNRLWVGTEENYFFSFTGESAPVQHSLGGFPLKSGTKIHASTNGDVWVLPAVPRTGATAPRHGIARYDGVKWNSYIGGTLGSLGDDDVLGITDGQNGDVWVGTWGGNVKHINPQTGQNGQLIIGNSSFPSFTYLHNGEVQDSWGKVDALALDSSGYLWIAVWGHDLGSLICYDPRFDPVSSESDPMKAHFRRFHTDPPITSTKKVNLYVDASNRIFLFDGQNKLTTYKHNGNPLTDSLRVVATQEIGIISGMEPGPDGSTLFISNYGIYSLGKSETHATLIDSEVRNGVSLAVRDSVLFIGTQVSGVLVYDLSSSEKNWLNESSGMLSNNVVSVAYSRQNGHLWALTDAGISEIDLGSQEKIAPREKILAYPNPFSISRRNQGAVSVTFAKLDPHSVISVYTLDGVLVSKVNSQPLSGYEWRASWTPGRSLAPGTYFAVVRPSGKRVKIILVP